MLTTALLICLCSSVYVTAGDSRTQCAPSTSMRITFRSHRNQSGHWRSMVSFKHSDEGSSTPGKTSEQWDVDVEQRSYVCEQNKATLETTLHFAGPALTAVPTVTKAPPPGYLYFAGSGYYKFHHDVTTWDVARERCVAEGGHLLVIDSDEEAEVVKQLFDLHPVSPDSAYNTNILVGIHKVNDEWITVLGDKMGSATTPYGKWAPGEPNYGDTCVAVLRSTAFYNNVGCSVHILAYICEIEL